MKHASILLLAIGLCGLSFAACAEGDSTTFGNKPGDGAGGEGNSGNGGNGGDGGKPSAASSSSSSSSSSSTSGGACGIKCTADTECQSSCSTPPVGINCCDIGTGTCYVSGADVCPSQGAGSSGGMYP